MSVNGKILNAALAEKTKLLHAHIVGGKSSSFIGADDGSASKSFNTGELPDDCALLGHLSGSQGHAGGDDCREALGNSSYRQADCDLKEVE